MRLLGLRSEVDVSVVGKDERGVLMSAAAGSAPLVPEPHYPVLLSRDSPENPSLAPRTGDQQPGGEYVGD